MKKIIILLISCFYFHSVKSQVSLQTGSATFNYPLFDWKDNKSRLNLSVALSYNSGFGVKVDEIPSNVGQGWKLFAGGVIIRNQIGQPDDQKPKDGDLEDITKYPAGYLYANHPANDGCPVRMARYPIFKNENQVYKAPNASTEDRELDYFSFQFNGRSGLFRLGKDGDKGIGITIGDSKLRIWYEIDNDGVLLSQNIRTVIKAFYIQDENGLIYKFNQLQKTKILKVENCDAELKNFYAVNEYDGGGVYNEAAKENSDELAYIINGWYLTQIEEPYTKRIVTINYFYENLNYVYAGNLIAYNSDKNCTTVTHNFSTTNTPLISSITCPDDYTVSFNYGNERFDFKNDKVLSSVQVSYQNRVAEKYVFNTAYFIYNFIGMPVNDFQKRASRLCLKSIQKFGPDLSASNEPYTFEYYTGSNLPDDYVPPPFCIAKDIWGYYNGDETRDFYNNHFDIRTAAAYLTNDQCKGLCFLRDGNSDIVLNINPGYAKNGLLKKINYPTGGWLKYEYEQNKSRFNPQDADFLVGGVHVSKTILNDGNYSFDCTDNSMVTNYSFVMPGTNNKSSMWEVEVPLNFKQTRSWYAPEVQYWHMTFHCLPFGCCDYRFQYPGILSRDQAMDLLGQSKFMETLNLVLDILNVISIVEAIYTAVSGDGYSSIAITIVLGLVSLFLSCNHYPYKDSLNSVYYNMDLHTMNPLPMQFKAVTITESSGSQSNGSTEIQFTSNDDYSVWEQDNPQLSMKQRYAFWAYGLPKETKIKDKNGNLVKRIVNDYEMDYYLMKNTSAETYASGGIPSYYNANYPGCNCVVKKFYSTKSDDFGQDNYVQGNESPEIVIADIYGSYTGRAELKSTTEEDYPNGTGTPLTKVTEYTYNKNFKPATVKTNLTNGNTKVTKYTYSGDTYQFGNLAGNLYDGMRENNLLDLPVATLEKYQTSSGDEFLLNETVIDYMQTQTGDIEPGKIFEHRVAEPLHLLGTNTSQIYHGSIPVTSNPDYKLVKDFSYDQTGSLVSVWSEGDEKNSFIYDYNGKFLTAVIKNSDRTSQQQNCAYTSFETAELGGWELTGLASVNNQYAITGKRGFDLNGSNSMHALVTYPNPYIISFWARSNSFTINNGTYTPVLLKSEPQINGFTYYEYKVPQINGSISLSGNTTIDELRLYPFTARMSTTSYDPLIGKTSECDINNRITYYEYDDNARLKSIKDEEGNIIKMMEYNVAKRSSNPQCPTSAITYGNVQMSQTFQKDCGRDDIFVGSMVEVVVAASTFTSTISQEYVDQLASNYLSTQGQTIANNDPSGYCQIRFWNSGRSQDFHKQPCALGYQGAVYTYAVPAHTYFSLVSQQDADNMAQADIDANGQVLANASSNIGCIISTEPVIESTGNTACILPGDPLYATYNPHYLKMEFHDINPNSPGFTDPPFWAPVGPDATCGATIPANIPITYSNENNKDVTVVLYNHSDNTSFNFTLPANTQSTWQSVPPGTYEVTVTIPWGSTANHIQVYSYFSLAPVFHEAAVSITTNTNPVISIY